LDEVKAREHHLSKTFNDKRDIQDNDIKALFFAFLNRARFKYSLEDIMESVMRCVCLRDLGDLRREKEYKKHFLFEKAEEKFMQELDVVRIVKTLRKFKMFA
jgi:stalled ribosome alternative rescue factor ArfA